MEAACGSTSNGQSAGGGDGGADVDIPLNCGKCGCGPVTVPPTRTILWTPDCSTPSADAGGTDAGDTDAGDTDAGDASLDATAPDPNACLQTKCDKVCLENVVAVGNVHASCIIKSEDAGVEVVECTYGLICGRRPAGFTDPTKADGRDPLAHYLASAALLEAVSVDAFAILADDLRAHGAPSRLVRAAERAARDEIRHARVMAAFASRAGADVSPPPAAARARRSLEAIAIENAQEGGVRETYGALLATWQSRAANDERFRAAMRRIARDETRHAELAWAVARLADTRLPAAARRRVERARQAAVDELVAACANEPAPVLVQALGMPRARHAQATAAALNAALWQLAA